MNIYLILNRQFQLVLLLLALPLSSYLESNLEVPLGRYVVYCVNWLCLSLTWDSVFSLLWGHLLIHLLSSLEFLLLFSLPLTFLYEHINMWFIFMFCLCQKYNFVYSDRKQSMEEGVGIDWKQAWGNFLGWWRCSKTELWWWLHNSTNLLKIINEYILWYRNYKNNFALKITYWPANPFQTLFYHTIHVIHLFSLKHLL